MLKEKKQLLIFISEVDSSPLLSSIFQKLLDSALEFQILCISKSTPSIIRENSEFMKRVRAIPCWAKKSRFFTFIFLLFCTHPYEYRIFFASGRIASQIAMLSGFIYRIPRRICIRHHGDAHHRYKLRVPLILDRIVNYCSTQIIAVSPAVSEVLNSLEKVNDGKIILINNGVVFPSSPIIRERPSGDIYTVLVVSRSEQYKNLPLISRAFKEYLKYYPASRLVMIGGVSDDEKSLVQETQKLLPKTFLRIIENQDIYDWFSKSDIFIHVPVGRFTEAFGLVYVESLASKIPCIFSLSGVVPDIPGISSFATVLGEVTESNLLKAMLAHREFTLPPISESCLNFLKSEYSMDLCSSRYLKVLQEANA